jgi:hypothetical protein
MPALPHDAELTALKTAMTKLIGRINSLQTVFNKLTGDMSDGQAKVTANWTKKATTALQALAT